jgi:hypothetical protein
MFLREIILKQLFSIPDGAASDLRNTPFFNILCANPSLAIFYADSLRRHGANPSPIKDLEVRSGIFSDPDQSGQGRPISELKKGRDSMAISQNARVCTHIKANGIRCGSPALREEVFCYFHQRMIRGVRTPPKSRIHPMALLENPESIQASLMETINALVRNQIDVERARLVLRALHIAVKNAPKVRFGVWPQEMVKEVPQYPDAPPSAGPFTTAAIQAEALSRIRILEVEEYEHERLSRISYEVLPDMNARKPPASVKAAVRSRSLEAAAESSSP